MLKAVQAVKAFQDKTWIPEDLSDWTFFSELDVWHYISISDERRCWNCEQFDGIDFFGDEIRTVFPDLQIRSANVIDVNVHITLWNKDTCRCKLVRTAYPKVGKFISKRGIPKS